MVDTTHEPGGASAPYGNDLQVRISRFREDLAEYDLRVRRTVREHPIATVAAAVLAGYLVGRIGRRS